MLYRMMQSLQDPDQLSEDRFVNTIYIYSAAAAGTTEFTAATTAYRDFWESEAAPSTIAVGSFISSTARGTGSVVKIYNMADPTPRPVRHEQLFTLGESATSATQLPNEVAVCLTFKAAPTAGIRPASLRGRIYIGPFNISALSVPGDDDHSRPKGALVDSMVDAAIRLKLALTTAGFTWVIASRTLGTFHEVAEVSVDNAWDTQRRRGIRPSLRRASPVATVGGGGSSGPF